jgi:hypothetical protein
MVSESGAAVHRSYFIQIPEITEINVHFLLNQLIAFTLANVDDSNCLVTILFGCLQPPEQSFSYVAAVIITGDN